MKKMLCSVALASALFGASGIDIFNNAKSFYSNGNYNESIELFKQAAEAFRQEQGEQSSDVAALYTWIGDAYANLGNYEKALEFYNKALAIREKVLGKEHPDTATSYNNIGLVYDKLNDYEKALEFYNKALAIREKVLGVEHLDTAISYNNIGVGYNNLGNYQKALEFYNKALAIKEKVLGKEHPNIATSYNNIGAVYNVLGNYEKALEFYNKALAIREKVLGVEHPSTANSYNSIGAVYYELGNYKKALEFYNKALAIWEWEKVLGVEHLDTARSYNNIGLVYHRLGNYEKALEFYNKALAIREKVLGKEHPDTAQSYNNIGAVYYNLGNYEKALEFDNKALAIQEKTLGKEHADTANSYNSIGAVYDDLGNYKKALEFYNKALAIQEKTLGKEHADTARIYGNIGGVYYKLGDYQKAYEYDTIAYNIYKNNRDKNFEFLSNAEKKNFVDSNKLWIVNLLSSASKYVTTSKDKSSTSAKTFDIWINDKGALLDNENAIAMLKSLSKDKAILDLIARLENYKREYAALSAKTPEPNEAQAYQAKLKELDNQISNTEKELGKHATSIQNALDIKDIKTADVAGYLKDNELFIDFGYFGKEYYAFSVDSKGAVEFKALDEKDAGILNDKIKAFRDSVYKIIDNKESDIISSNENAKKELESIYKLVFEKALANRADSYDSLIISGDGMLRLLPFEALRFDDKYLIESKNIRYASSAKEFVRAHKFNNAENSSTLSVFSDPDYDKTGNEKAINIDDSASTRALGRAGVFTRLRGFKIEADAIQEQASGEVKMYSRADANEINLFAQKSPKILHIITHGIFINDENIINPMLKSGIALSGANTENKEGVVMALKLSGLSLKGTDMVVLSACETGVIDPKDTSAAAALPKTFIQAGAKNVMMSLWKVDDAHTVRLMKEFYADTSKGNYNELLRNSKLQMIKEGIHPYYWAGFIISGE
ncbi:tetratricopeptide repeat protein [Campylobacter magnus]|uniref:Tetratricopeptide repeat protein n=1 Tax=Campylobacter magnus TaxID=3026462 RepID=A0ABT8T631_9BACT|nr:tetratricopeptide repeat protein [Campylobacter magnus]MDO2408594.1 tetratricopeptide repeat protein [Campylobacter magnus]